MVWYQSYNFKTILTYRPGQSPSLTQETHRMHKVSAAMQPPILVVGYIVTNN